MAKEKAPLPAAAPAEDKKRAIEAAMGQIEKMYGKGSIMRLGDQNNLQVDVIPTGSLSLDVALGVGGLPRGRIVEIYGPESSGKTTLALHVAAEAQKKGGEVAFVDAEHALDPTYARALGVNIDEMLISQPDTGEQALEITEALVRSGAIDVIVVDSVAALVPRAEIEGEMGDSYVGLHARLMSQALRKLTGAVGKTNTIVIFINQLREKVGVMYGNPEVTTGGRALKFYASVRIDVRRIEALKNGGEVVGNRTRAKVVKNKVAPPFREAEFDIMYGEGIAHTGELIDLGVRLGIITKAGSWFSMGEVRIGQGRDAAKKYLEENPDIAADVEAQIRANFDKLMGNQSRIAAAKHKRGRVLVFLADGSLLKVTEQELLTFGLRSGDELDEETLTRLKESAGVSNIKTTAADLVGRRAMSRRDLEKKLQEKGASETEARYAGEWLEAIGALDDGAYAAALVRHCGDMGYGPRRAREKLREKGVPQELWDEALDELPPDGEQIDRFLQSKLHGRFPEDKEKKRLTDALLRRGFSWGEVKSAWGRYGSEIWEE